MDRALDAQRRRARQASSTDPSDFRIKHEPGHPAADANGNVKYPNVNPLVEMTDMREAQRSYEANINVIGATRRMIQRTHRHPQSLIRRATMATPIIAANAYAKPRQADRSVAASAKARRRGVRRAELRRDAQGCGRLRSARPAHKSDVQTQALAAGKANIVDVVTAVAETEVAIEALVSVRDKVISAYEEIMRMPI